MNIADFDFNLPEALIAQYPLPTRTASRLLCLSPSTGEIQDRVFSDLLSLLHPGDLLVFNDTRVMPARLFGTKITGGRVEILIERILPDNQALAHIKNSRSLKPKAVITLDHNEKIEVIDKQNDLVRIRFLSDASALEVMNRCGKMPLPPYITRDTDLADEERYQTVYSKTHGAVAAPTAGLHFDEPLLQALQQKGIQMAFVTLHVGAGTFQPVRVENIHDHVMHAEYLEVSESVCNAVRQTKAKGGRVIAVGTTSVRSLETASRSGELKPYQGDTQLFIYPGFQFHCIDGMITNFHLPRSTLLMLVSAFAGQAQVLNAYQHAVDKKYRFFSYGDAMIMLSGRAF